MLRVVILFVFLCTLNAYDEYKKAEKLYENLCKKDDLEACYKLAITKEYLEKHNPDSTNELAIKEILINACDKNHAKSCRKLAWIYDLDFDDENRFENVEKFLTKSCDLKDTKACCLLVDSSNAKYEFKASLDHALRYEIYHKTCNAGAIESCKKLNMQNISNAIYKKAREYYKQECDEEDLYYGCFNLAMLYDDGLGGKKDLNQALKLYNKACEDNNQLACYKIGKIYEKEANGGYVKAFKYYEKLCKDYNGFACEGLAYLYENGLGVEKNLQKAKEYYGIAMGLYDEAMIRAGNDEEQERYYKLEKLGYKAIYLQ